jgi:AraC-like DNA-binding protein
MSDRLDPENYPMQAHELDLLTDILTASHKGTAYDRGWYRGTWNLAFTTDQERGFHIVTEGEAWIRMKSGETYLLGEGDVALVSEYHEFGSDLSATPVPFTMDDCDVFKCAPEEGEVCCLCGAYLFEDASQHPLFSHLPPIIVVRAGDRDSSIDAVIDLLDREFSNGTIGSRSVAERLIDTLLIYLLRHWIERACSSELGWLRALRDPVLAKTLSLLHHDYERAWTLARLARAVGTSRASLARKFTAEVGVPVIQYLTERRLDAARGLLLASTQSLDEIATQVGYASAFSLSKAFKRHFGEAPTHFVASRAGA